MSNRHKSILVILFSVVVWFAEVHDFAAYLYDAICILEKVKSLNASTSGRDLCLRIKNAEFTGSTAVCLFPQIFTRRQLTLRG